MPLKIRPDFFLTPSGQKNIFLRREKSGYLEHKRTIICILMVPSFNWKEKRETMLRDYAVTEDDKLVMTSDKTFSSPSTAADFCLGRCSNGWLEWKDKDGKTLDSTTTTRCAPFWIWKYQKNRLKVENSEQVRDTNLLKLLASDGKRMLTGVLDSNGITLLLSRKMEIHLYRIII